MRRAILLVALLPLIIAAKPAWAGGPQPLAFDTVTSYQRDHIIEQQTAFPVPDDPSQWVINPGTCHWDPDDRTQWLTPSGYLLAGTSASVQTCSIVDPNPLQQPNGTWYSYQPHPSGLFAASSSADLIVTLCESPGGCRSAIPVYDAPNHRYTYTVCAFPQYDTGDPAVVSIDGSQGGIGVPTTDTFTVTNPTNKKVAGVFADAELVGFPGPLSLTCPTSRVLDYPITWAQ